MSLSGDFAIIAGIVMPDHVHLLGILGPRLTLPRVIGKLKSQTRVALESSGATWQENFYDHRLRDASATEAFARYIFLNPYRAKLVSCAESWPLWWRGGPVRFRFEEAVMQNAGVPARWFDEPDPVGAVDL